MHAKRETPTAPFLPHADAIAAALTAAALPGELEGFDVAARDRAAAFVAKAAAKRAPGKPAIRLESLGSDGVHRIMRLAVINDDMPFLVDSIAAAVSARGLVIRRLLHPIVAVRRAADGTLAEMLASDREGARRESIIYMEIDRADARTRRAMTTEIGVILDRVRAAVRDWPQMQQAMRDDADGLPDGEGAALLRWFLDGNMTLLGAEEQDRDGFATRRMGILQAADAPPLWTEEAREAAFVHFERGAEAPLLLKAEREADVHRRAPLDLAVVPRRTDGQVTALAIHCGLWTSAALAARPDRVPMLRRRLAAIEERFGFDPRSHAGKALRHALSVLPHDLLIGFSAAALEEAALTAMSLADRPRPKLLLVPAPLGQHMFAFVWLPRDEVPTARRVAVGRMLEEATGGRLTGWALESGDAALAFLRYTLEVPAGAPAADAGALDRALEEMVRGWAPALEAELAAHVGASRATRLAITYAGAFPPAFRARYSPAAAAQDVLRLAALEDAGRRGARFYRTDGDAADRLRLKIYTAGALVPLSEVVPVLENFGFRVLEEMPSALDGGRLGHVHEFLLDPPGGDAAALLARVAVTEAAVAEVLEGGAENDAFNQLIVALALEPRAVVLFRAWFRYLRQTGLSYGLATVVDALRRAPEAARGLIALFEALHAPEAGRDAGPAEAAIDTALAGVAAIDDDRILRRIRAVVRATLRTNAFTPAAAEALAFKFDSKAIPGLPAPVPWREIWVYSPRIEGIHLRGGPIARGGLRWSDRRDDFRTEILGLMKAQVVKNAVIVPTGAKGGFYPKQLPAPADRKAWLAEGTESYRIFIRALLSVTDNIVDGAVVHPAGVTVRDGDDPYFVVAADKGTATFSDVANAIAEERGFWLGDAFASGGSHGYDHKAMGITARGAWVSVTRHFAEIGVDVQKDAVTVAGCGDMSGDVFGNGMLLSKSLRLVAAFDHRHIFLDPAPDPARSWEERDRLFHLPASSWADYDARLISPGGGVFPRSQKAIPVSPEVRALLGIDAGTIDPSALIAAILKAPVDLLWFGGIGTYIKASHEGAADVGDPANDAHRVNAVQLRARVIGEGANLSTTQAGRIEFARAGGRINTDFIDNSAGVDCSDNEVNIKIPLNREVREGRLSFEARNALLAEMTDDVAAIVLEDNRLQTLALSAAERGGAAALGAQVRVVEVLEAAGRLDRAVEGLEPSAALLRRAQDGQGLTRPELAVLLAHGKMALQTAVEGAALPDDPALKPLLHGAFPAAMRERHAAAIDAHRLRREIVATKLANLVVNRLGIVGPFELAEEEGCALSQVAAGYVAVDRLFDLAGLWGAIEQAPVGEVARLTLLDAAATAARLHIADLLRAGPVAEGAGAVADRLAPGVAQLDAAADDLLREAARLESGALRERLDATGAPAALIGRIVRLFELDGVIGLTAMAATRGLDAVKAASAYVRLGEALGIDWAKAAALRSRPSDPWERLLVAGIVREFEQLRVDFLARDGTDDPEALVDAWLATHRARVGQFAALVGRARAATATTPAMLAQIAAQARVLLAR